MVSDKELMEWAEKYYPEFKHNLKLIRLLWERLQGRGVEIEQGGFVEKKINELEEGELVEVVGVVVRFLRSYKYEGCKTCFRKACYEHGERGTIIRNAYEIGDDTGFVRIVMPRKVDDDSLELKVGQVVCVRGKVSRWNDVLEINVYEYEILRDAPKVEEESKSAITKEEEDKEAQVLRILRNLKSVKDMEKDVFVRYIERKGFKWEDFEPYVKVEVREDGKEWVVFE